MKKNLLIVGDSLGLPRDNMPYSNTWTYLLCDYLQNFHTVLKLQRALNSNTINSGVKEDWLEFYKPDDVILQVGIVDCSPRFLKNGGLLMKLVNISPFFLKNFIWKLIKKYKTRSVVNVDVTIDRFESNIEKYINRCISIGVSRIFLIKIAKSGSAMVKKSPEILSQINLYNQIFDTLAGKYQNCILINELTNANDDYFIEDGYHLSEFGNYNLFEAIKKYYK